MQCYTLKMEEQRNMGEKARVLLDSFLKITDELAELPPIRPMIDHSIPLIEGENPVNLRPYRYPAMQKSVIEGLIKEMLRKV